MSLYVEVVTLSGGASQTYLSALSVHKADHSRQVYAAISHHCVQSNVASVRYIIPFVVLV